MARVAALATALGTALLVAPAAAQKIGTASAVNPASSGAPPGGSVRTLTLGAEVVHNERIHTDAKGSVQLLFVDRTSMSIGPNSDVTIDEYVFDPKANTGKLAVRVGKGLLRFVGGQVSHSGEATVTTPSASIGIRGGTGFIEVNGENTRTLNLFGQQTVNVGGTTTSLYRPNFMLDISGSGIVNPPIPAPPQLIARYIAALEAQIGQNGGSRSRVTGQAVQAVADAHNVTGPIGIGSNPVQAPTTWLNWFGTNPSWPTWFQSGTLWQSTLLAMQQSQQQTAAIASAPHGFGRGPFLMQMTNCCDPNHPTSWAPYIPGNIAFSGNPQVSPLIGYANGSDPKPNGANGAQTLQFGFNLSGTQASQQSWFFVATGTANTRDAGNQAQLNGLFLGSAKPSSTQPMSFAVGGFSSSPFQLDGSGMPVSITVKQDPQALAVSNLTSFLNYTFTQTATSTTNVPSAFPRPIGVNRPEVTLAGFAGGLVQTLDGASGQLSDPYIITGATGTSNDVTVKLNPSTSQMEATLNIVSVNPNGPNPLTSAVYKFEPNTSTSAYIDYNYFGSVSIAGSPNTPASTVNNQPLQSTAQSFVNIPASVAQAAIASVVPGGQVCQCDYTRWGMWSTDSFRTTTGGNLSQDLGHANLWVAGQLPNVSDVPSSGTATYVGHVVGQVRNGSSQYLSGGAFTNTVNFGTKTGTVAAGLDGGVYIGTVNLNITDPRKFSGNLPISNFSSAGLPYTSTMTVNGSFFKGVSGPVGEMGGGVFVQAPGFPNYVASGIFAAKVQ